jgi:hypothetical protein
MADSDLSKTSSYNLVLVSGKVHYAANFFLEIDIHRFASAIHDRPRSSRYNAGGIGPLFRSIHVFINSKAAAV